MLKKMSIATSLALLISVLVGCSSTPEKNYLEEHAAYDMRTPPMLLPSVKNGKPLAYMPVRVPKRAVVAWLYDHDLAQGDRFLGGWISLLVSNETWEMKPVELPPEIKLPPKTKKRGGSNAKNTN